MSYDQNLADCEAALADLAATANHQSRKLTEANKLLEQTIEVLEAVDARLRSGLSDCPVCGTLNYGDHFGGCQGTKPLLDNLKALKKEGTE